MRTFDFELLSIEIVRDEFPVLWATAKKALPRLNNAELAIVVSLVTDTCPYCHENDIGCHCANDE